MKEKQESGYDVAVGPCRFVLRLYGMWPESLVENRWYAHLRVFFVICTMVFFTTITQTMNILRVWGDLNLVTEVTVNSQVPTSTAAMKMAGAWYYRKTLRNLLIQIVKDWQMTRNTQELRIMESNAKFCRLVTATSIFLSMATFIIQCLIAILSIFSHKKYLKTLNESTEWPLYMKAAFPYDVQASPYYELTFFGQFLSNAFAASTYTPTDSLFIILMLHVCGQLTILKLTFTKNLTKLKSRQDPKMFVKTIADIHKRHNQLHIFANTIEKIFNKTFIVQLLGSSIVLCMLGYQIVTISKASVMSFMDMVFLIYFILCFLFISFTYCYMAEKLQEESMSVCEAIYNCNWFDLPCHQSKLLILIMIRSRKPFTISAGKFVCFSLGLYCSILRSSAGYMSMLLAIQQRLIDK